MGEIEPKGDLSPMDKQILREIKDASREIECECGWKGHWVCTAQDGSEHYCPNCGANVTSLCFPEDGRC